MTLLERTSVDPLLQDEDAGFDQQIVRAMSRVPGAVGVAIYEIAEGSRVVLVYDAPVEQVNAVEEVAMDQLLAIERENPDLHLDPLFLSVAEAADVRIPDAARTHALPA